MWPTWWLSNLLIYLLQRFKNNQNERVVGLSEVAKRRREQRNVVTMKFNLINYLLETVSVLMSLLVKNFFVDLLYYLVNYCGTPLVYYLGIEENRRQAEEYFRQFYLFLSLNMLKYSRELSIFRSNIRIFRRQRVGPEFVQTLSESVDTRTHRHQK